MFILEFTTPVRSHRFHVCTMTWMGLKHSAWGEKVTTINRIRRTSQLSRSMSPAAMDVQGQLYCAILYEGLGHLRTLVPMCVLNCSVVSTLCDSLWPCGLQPTRLFWPWSFLGKNTGAGYHFLLQGIFPTQGSNPYFLHWQVNSLPLSHLGNAIGTHGGPEPSYPMIQWDCCSTQ